MGTGPVRRRAVFLDRDGVVNQAVVRDGKPYPPESAAQLQLVEGAHEALQNLHDLGFVLLVVTNQPDVARGTQSRQAVEGIHALLQSQLPIRDFFICYHDDADLCECRKPLPGLIFEAAEKYGIELSESYLIGDRWRDIEAGRSAGCQTILIDYGYRERGPRHPPHQSVRSLTEAAKWIIEQNKNV